jgi:hypothetical protein
VLILFIYGYINSTDAIVAMFIIGIIGTFNNWMHHVIHVEGHWAERFIYFHDLRALHYTHHQGDAKHNFGVIDFLGDVLSKSTEKPDYTLSNNNIKKLKTNKEKYDIYLKDVTGDGTEHCSKVESQHITSFPTIMKFS